MFCSYCGEQIPNTSKICPYCGGTLNSIGSYITQSSINIYRQFIPQMKEALPEFRIGGTCVSFSEDFVMKYNAKTLVEELEDYNNELRKTIIKKETDFDNLVENVRIAILAMAHSVSQIAYNILYEVNDRKEFLSRADYEADFLTKINVEESLGFINRKVDIVENLIEKLAAHRQEQKEMKKQSEWVGGGFGIKGALLGSIQASILNLGGDIIHGITNSASLALLGANDRKQIEKVKIELFNEGTIQEIFRKYVSKINSEVEREVFGALDKKYGGSSVNIIEKYRALEEAVDISRLTEEQRKFALDAYLLLIKDDPYFSRIYLGIYNLDHGTRNDLVSMARYFGIAREVINGMLKTDYDNIIAESRQIIDDNKYKTMVKENIDELKKNYSPYFTTYDFDKKDEILELERKVSDGKA